MRAETETQANTNRNGRARHYAFWAATLLIAFENAAGAMWVFLPLIPELNHSHTALIFNEYLRVMLVHLGYPPYFKYILGPWQLACAAALLAPRLPRVKEWAYVGAFFNYSSAIVSHLFAGDRLDIAAAVMAVLTVVSWSLRPEDRRLSESVSVGEISASSWVVSAGLLILLLVLSLFWLPQIPKQ
jgi:hypothetical protein